MAEGISFLYSFDVGNRNVETPAIDIVECSPTAEGDFAPENIFTDSVRHTWRTQECLTPQYIIIKAQKKTVIDTFAILGHNFSPDAIITIEANIGNNFTAPPVKFVVPAYPDNLVIAQEFDASCDHYKITVLDPTNPCGYIEFGRVIGGRALIMRNDEDITDSYSVSYKDNSEKLRTLGFFTASNENITSRDLSCSFSKLYTVEGKNENYVKLREMFKLMKTTKPFLTVLDRASPNKLAIWGQLKSIPNDSFTVNDFVSMSLSIAEVF